MPPPPAPPVSTAVPDSAYAPNTGHELDPSLRYAISVQMAPNAPPNPRVVNGVYQVYIWRWRQIDQINGQLCLAAVLPATATEQPMSFPFACSTIEQAWGRCDSYLIENWTGYGTTVHGYDTSGNLKFFSIVGTDTLPSVQHGFMAIPSQGMCQ
ncbi:MAG TPA: hypothetical protein VKU62_08765 [Thermoanaerobaculia bacterium]|nr:hypothetical protein [Thermoanaerobaculia bacterium]